MANIREMLCPGNISRMTTMIIGSGISLLIKLRKDRMAVYLLFFNTDLDKPARLLFGAVAPIDPVRLRSLACSSTHLSSGVAILFLWFDYNFYRIVRPGHKFKSQANIF